MQGLRTQEGDKFLNFFAKVQDTAKKHRKVFFLDFGDGRDIVTDEMEGEDLQGWIVPQEKVKSFEEKYLAFLDNELPDEFYGFAVWVEKNGEIFIRLEQYTETDEVEVFD
jgi:hypothetical protein